MTETAAAPPWATHWTRLALAALPADLTTATPPQVDECIRTLELDWAHQSADVAHAAESLHRYVGHDYRRIGRSDYRWYDADGNEVDSMGAVFAAARGEGLTCYADERIAGLAAYNTARANRSEIRIRILALTAEYNRRGGWTRYYRVNNSNGHVHTDRDCRTTYDSTPWSWPTQLSGADAQTVVDAAGPLTCLVCFPGQREDILAARPVRFDMFETAEQADERIKREQAAAARTAEKIAKGLTADGSPLVVAEPSFREGRTNDVELKTARAGELRYVEFAAHARLRRTSEWARGVYTASAEQILAAIAAKRGTDIETARQSFTAKVDRKVTAEDW